MRKPVIAVISGIWGDRENRAGNSTVPQGCQGSGYVSPAAALAALRSSALEQPRRADGLSMASVVNPQIWDPHKLPKHQNFQDIGRVEQTIKHDF